MEKFQWSLLKTLEFVNSRRPDLEIRANFLNQLQVYIKRSKIMISEDEGPQQTEGSLPTEEVADEINGTTTA